MHNAKLVHCLGNAEDLIAFMARVSNPSNQNNNQTAPRLLRYCIDHKHWSPFEMASMCVEINTTRSIAAQILRHRSFSFQEFSQRYSNVENLGKPVIPNLRTQDTKNRQNSIDNLPDYIALKLQGEIADLYEKSMRMYDRLLEKGVAKECARDVLPLSVPSRLYMHGTLRSWITYIALREKNGTQFEHQKIALSCKELFCDNFPVIAEALGGQNEQWNV